MSLREHQTDLTEIALGQRPPSLAKCFLGELIHRPTGKWSFLKRGLPDPSIWQRERERHAHIQNKCACLIRLSGSCQDTVYVVFTLICLSYIQTVVRNVCQQCQDWNNITMAWCHHQKISSGYLQQVVNMVKTNRKTLTENTLISLWKLYCEFPTVKQEASFGGLRSSCSYWQGNTHSKDHCLSIC